MTTILNVEDARQAARRGCRAGCSNMSTAAPRTRSRLRETGTRSDSVRLSPSVLVDVSSRKQGTGLLGEDLPMPMVIAPTAVAGLVWHDGEIALAKAAAAAGIPFCVSTQSITSIERIAAESGASLWFQLYVWQNRERTLALIDRAWAPEPHARPHRRYGGLAEARI